VAEVFKGGRKFSRVRLVAKNKDSPTHTTEQIIPVWNGLKPNKNVLDLRNVKFFRIAEKTAK
jgi:hypothetical protein